MDKIEETKQMERLVEKFFDGATTLEEEDRLYAFFASDDVPAALAEYAEVFRAFSSMSAGVGNDVELKPRRRRRVMRLIVASVAAAVLLLFGISVFHNVNEEKRLASLYEGSYMIVNGERIDDLGKIRPHIESALSSAEKIERAATDMSVVEQAQQSVLDCIGDPVERERMRRLLAE